MRRLIIRPGAIGDFIVSLPALEHLKAAYTEVWAASPNGPLARFADHAASLASTGLDGLELNRAPASLRERLASFDEIHCWYGSARSEFREAVRRLPFRFYQALPQSPGVHATDFYLEQVGAPPGGQPRIEVPPQVRGTHAVIHPFSGSAKKNWPIEQFRHLAAALGNVQWTAGPEEALDEAVRFDNLFDLACWLKQARVYIGNDSGITHLAAAVGVPTVALFGPTDATVWAPRGALVMRQSSSVQDVLQACLRLT